MPHTYTRTRTPYVPQMCAQPALPATAHAASATLSSMPPATALPRTQLRASRAALRSARCRHDAPHARTTATRSRRAALSWRSPAHQQRRPRAAHRFRAARVAQAGDCGAPAARRLRWAAQCSAMEGSSQRILAGNYNEPRDGQWRRRGAVGRVALGVAAREQHGGVSGRGVVGPCPSAGASARRRLRLGLGVECEREQNLVARAVSRYASLATSADAGADAASSARARA